MTEISCNTTINKKRVENPQEKKTSQRSTTKKSGTEPPLFKASRPSAELEAQLKKLGLINYNGYGNKVIGHYSKTNRQEEFTVIGQGANGRTIAQSKSGQVVVIAHNGIILKSDYVQNPQKYKDAKTYNENVKTIKSAGNLAQQFYQIADDNSGLNSMKKMQNLLDTKINSKNIVAFLDEYDKDNTKREDRSIIDTVTSEVGAGGTKQQRQVLMTIMNKLAQAAKEAGVSDGDIKKAKADFEASLNKEFNASFRRTNPKDMEYAMDFLRGSIAAKQTSNVRNITDKEAIQAFTESFSAENQQAQSTYNQAKGEGWSFSARMGDTICGWFGCNTIEEVEAKLGENAKDVILLMSAKTEEEFKQYYKKVTDGIEFDPQKIAATEAAQTNLTMAQGLSSSIKTYNQILTKSNGQSLAEFENSVKGGLKMSDEQFNALKNTVYSNCKTESDKKQALNQYLRTAQEEISTEYRNLTKGKTLEQMQKEAKLISQSTFGTKIITKDSNQFTQNMATTEMVSDIAGDIALTVALSAIPGGAAWATARMATTAAKWGVKGAKLAKTLNKTAIGFNKVKKFEQGTKWAAQAKRGDTGAKVANVTAKTVSSAGNAIAGTAIYEASATNHSAEEIKEKCLTNGIYGAIGAGASELAPKLMSAFKINSSLANEVAEEIVNATGALGVETAKGGEYGTSDATIDIVSGILMARLSHVGGGGVKVKGGGSEISADAPNTKTNVDETTSPLTDTKNTVKNNGTTMTFDQMTERLKNGHVNYTLLKTEDGRKLIRIENSTKAFSSDKFDYYEFDSSGNMVKSQTQISKNTAIDEFKEFENASSVNVRNRGGRLNAGIPVMDAAEGIDAKVTSSNIRKEVGNIDNSVHTTPTEVLTDTELKYLGKMTKFPNETQATFNGIAQRIKNGEIPSSEMFEEVLSDISQKTGVSTMDLRRDFSRGMKCVGSEWSPIESAFKKNRAQNLADIEQGKSFARGLNRFKEKRGLLSTDEMKAKQEADLKAQQDAELKAKQEAELKAKEEAELQARREAEKQAEIEAQKAKAEKLEQFAQKYPEVVNEGNFRSPDTAPQLIDLMEKYDLDMSYENFNPQEIYREIHNSGINNDADADIAFKLIKKRFHSNVIDEEARVAEIKNKYKISDYDSITHSDNVIKQLEQSFADGKKVTMEDIDNLISNNIPDVREFDRIKKRVLETPELQKGLNDSLHLDVYSNPTYAGFEHSIPDAMTILDNLLADARSGKEITHDLVNSHIDKLDDNLRANGKFLSTESYWILQDVLRKHPELAAKCKNFVEDIIHGGFEP